MDIMMRTRVTRDQAMAQLIMDPIHGQQVLIHIMSLTIQPCMKGHMGIIVRLPTTVPADLILRYMVIILLMTNPKISSLIATHTLDTKHIRVKVTDVGQ